ncbi:MAG: hypothetical protein DRI94_03650 [Bacteroidetes bacterium]|nr:MAG: hypothetical protein DRI94_03650 [Bacteroidota bacterium]
MIVIRQKYLDRIIKAFKYVPIVVLIGSRQVGKTHLMKSINLKGDTIFLNGQDSEIANYFAKYSIIEGYLKPRLNNHLKGNLIIDEFQYIPEISVMLKLLTDNNPDLKILCSGSSSLDIIQKVNESLAGRVRIINVYSLSFEEYLLFTDKKLHKIFQNYREDTEYEIIEQSILQKLNEYLIYGGFPRQALVNDYDTKTELIDDIYKTYLIKDVRSYIRNEDTVGFNKLLRLLASQIGNLINVNELSKISGLSYKKCDEYIYLLEQMYIIKLVEPYSTNKRKVISKMKKVYFTDLGLRNRIYNNFNEIEFRNDNGALFENYVFLEISRIISNSASINFYRTNDGAEIDFIIQTMKNIYAAEVKYSTFKNAKAYKNLRKLAKNEDINKIFLINNNLNEIFNEINYKPACLVSKTNFE